ncbi:conserved hypothetical protein [Sporisorium reilianum SRZ2]|uniref:Peptidase M20 dimerisation domain-containing protein n=1 Tax=Sporisorium reilianum (strain SRZ2) TaxID=999809 RepID=E6ZZ61_SPORE|nr:conserved hypothetical protein [Sporisorium reilianum SRZ2]
MCSPNVHYEHFLNRPPSSSRQPTDNIASLAQAISSLSSTSTANASAAASTSALLGHTINHHSSVLSLVVDERRSLLYSGSQEGCISVWDLGTYHSTARLSGHTASVLALELAPEKSWLFSSSGDNTVRVWDTLTNTPLFVILPAEDNVGDIFALKWCAVLETLYIGCQSTSIQWICLAGFDKRKRYGRGNVASGGGLEGRLADGAPGATTDDPFRADSPIISTPDLLSRPHKFFDSVPVALSRSGMGSAGTSTPTRPNARPSAVSALSSTDAGMHRKSPLIPESEQAFHSNGALATAGATEKVLHAASQRLDSAAVPSPGLDSSAASIDPGSDSIRTLLIPPTSSVPSAHFGYVYCLALLTLEGDTEHPTVLASGSGDESIKLWHATRSGLSLLATLESPNADGNAVLALASWKTTLFSGLQGGEVEVWDLETCTLVRTIRAHTDDVICLETCPESGLLFTAGADGKVHTWDRSFRCSSRVQAHDGIVLSLTKVRSEAPDAVDDARASRPGRKRRCLFYGHYDCIAAEGSWASDPFTLDGRDGYLYGRGVSDNKGPILAAACAVHHLLSTRRLYSDVVFLIEGEEENGSAGFVEAVRRYKREIGEIDVVLLSNSYWLDEETPCLTIGLRGVVRATVSVASGDRDVHSGVEGGAIREPMVDMVKLLARLTGSGEQVALPGFYDSVRPITETEIQAYKDIVRIKQSLKSTAGEAGGRHSETVESLMAKWRNPSLSVHNIRVSGPGNSTVIPSSVSAQVSLRLVPDQDLPTIEASLLQHVHTTFDSLYPPLARPSSRNKVSVSVDHRADWWLGSSSSSYLQLLRHAVKHEWDAEPILIREGGSIPAIAILEKELGACAVHLPMGQSSDNAHLPNERLRQRNLVKGQNVVRRFIQGLAAI